MDSCLIENMQHTHTPMKKRTYGHNSKNSKFQKGSGSYICSECGKRTRDTGNGEGELRLCRHCLEQGEWDNFIEDGGDPSEVPAEFKPEP